MSRKKNGFTMVELLAAIVILGLLSAFAIVSVNVILDRAEKNHYETQEKNLIMAAQSYASDNQNVLPKEIGGSTTIKLSDLQTRKYIGEVVDRSKNVCTEGSVTIFRYSKDGYSYRPYLKCPKFETSEDEYGGTGPEINITVNTNYTTPSFSYEITNNDDGKIIAYSYVIYKYGVLVRDSGSVPVSSAGSIEPKEVSLKDLVPGEFEIVFTATNNYGYTTTETESASIIDATGPTCYNIQPDYTEDDWRQYDVNNPIVITVNCKDENGSGCAKEIFSQAFSADTGTHYIEMIDNDGRVGNCVVGVYIDNTPPDKPVLNNPYENTWINKSYTITATSKDDASGIAYFQYRYPNSVVTEEREWKTYENSSADPGVEYTFTTTSFSKERSEYVEIRACDYAGNCSEATSSMIKIDKTAPSCTIARSLNTPNGNNGWYVSSVTMTMTNVDNLGSVATAVASPLSYELTTSKTASYVGMNLTATQTDTVAAGVIYNGYIMDEAGNKGACSDDSALKIDLTPPEVPVITNPNANTDGTVNWINANYAVTAKSKDVHSGIDYFQYSSDNSSWTKFADSSANPNTYKTVTSSAFSVEGQYGYYVNVCDVAGNCSSSASTTIKLDKTAPTCTVAKSIESPNGSNSWYVSNVGLTLNVDDPGVSDKSLVSYDLKNANSASYGGTTTGTQSDTKGITWYGFVKDEAGNTNSCNSGSFKVDITAPTTPTITNSNGATWVKANYTVKAKSKDVTAGIAYFQYSTNNSSWTTISNTAADPGVEKTATSPTISTEGNYTYYIRTCDKAGNCSTSSSTNVKLDKTAPSCTTSKSNLNTTSGVTVAIACSENGVAGVTKSGVSSCAGVSDTSASKTGVKEDKTYTVTDVAGNSATCSVDVSSKTQYNKRTCAANRCAAAGCQSGTAYYTRCYVSFINCTEPPNDDGTCSNGTYNSALNRCEKSYTDGRTTCPFGHRQSLGHALSDGSESYSGSCTAVAKPTTCGSYPLTTPGKYIYSCNCTTYNSDSSKCACSSWNSWGSWSDSSSNYCTDSWTCDGSTRTVYY